MVYKLLKFLRSGILQVGKTYIVAVKFRWAGGRNTSRRQRGNRSIRKIKISAPPAMACATAGTERITLRKLKACGLPLTEFLGHLVFDQPNDRRHDRAGHAAACGLTDKCTNVNRASGVGE
jgi:hypothetical protein